MDRKVGFLKMVIAFLKEKFGSKPSINNENSSDNVNIVGGSGQITTSRDTINNSIVSNANNNNTTNSNITNIYNSEKTITNMYKTSKTMLEIKKDTFELKAKLYDNLLSYRNIVYATNPMNLFIMGNNPKYQKKIKKITFNIDEAIDMLREHHPELCILAKKVSIDINSYYVAAVPYGTMKFNGTDNDTNINYNSICDHMDEAISNLDKSFFDYMTEHRK